MGGNDGRVESIDFRAINGWPVKSGNILTTLDVWAKIFSFFGKDVKKVETRTRKAFNWIDIVILLALLAIAGYAGSKLVIRERPLGTIRSVDVVVKKQTAAVMRYLQAGDELYNTRYKNGRKPFARIDRIYATVPAVEMNEDTAGRVVVSQNPILFDVTLQVKFLQPFTVYPDKTIFGKTWLDVPLNIGKTFTLANYKIQLNGEIIAQDFKPAEAK